MTNIIKDLKRKCKEDDKGLFEDLLRHIEVVLNSVDEFYNNVFFKIYQLIYINEKVKSQLNIGLELDISQSNVCKLSKKIGEYIINLLKSPKYVKLFQILNF